MTKKEFDNYILNTFHAKRLEPPVYCNFPIGIRFEIGVGSPYRKRVFFWSALNKEYFENCFIRAQTLFDALFEKDDDIFLVVDNAQGFKYTRSHMAFIQKETEHVCYSYKYSFQNDENDEFVFNRNIFKTKVSEIDISGILMESVYSDFPMNKAVFGHVYLIHFSKKIIFHLYDDRGLDVIASEKAALIPIYNQFSDWILDYDREKIDTLFSVSHH